MKTDRQMLEAAAAALASEQYPAQRWPEDFESPDNLRADAEAVLAAIGLDAELLAKVADRFYTPEHIGAELRARWSATGESEKS